MSDSTINPATIEYAKRDLDRRKKRRAVASIAGLFLVAGIASAGYFGWAHYQKAKADALAAQLAAEDPGKLFAAVQNGELTREQAREAGRQQWERREQEAMAGYFKTPAADREKYLDKMIDEMQKEMERRRTEWMRNRPTTGPATQPDWRRDRGPASRPSEAEMQARGRARADNTSPLQRAQQSEFRTALMARMQARGIQGPFGRGPGGWGGRGR